MPTRPNTRPCPKPTRARSALILFLASGSALAALGCGGGDGGVGPAPTITIALAGDGRGTVIGSTGGLNCTNAAGPATPTGTCNTEVAEGSQVTLAATPAPNSSFAGWSGDGVSCPASAPCTVTVDQSRTVTATFDNAPTNQLLTVAGGGAGTGSGTVVSDPAGIDCTISSGTAGATGCSATFPTGTPVQLIETGNLVAWGGACSGTTCSTTMSEARTVIATFAADAQATQLAFVGQPSAIQTGTVITPAVQVAVQDAAGQTVAGRTDAITLAIAANPGSATLGGQLTRNAVNGVATFPDLTLNQVGTAYTLRASASGLPDETSTAFDVEATPVAQLAFSVQPSTAVAGVSIAPAVQVEIRDQTGAVLTTRTDEITISLQTNPAGGTLSGTTTATAVAGVATFSNLSLQKAGTGYTLAVATQAASGAVSGAFDIVAGPARLVVKNSTDPQSAPVSTPVGVRPSVKVTDAFNNPVQGVPVTWQVLTGEGTVVASVEDPVVRPTGPLGLSTVVSWTLGPEVGDANNTLRASVSGTDIIGSPIIFTASGTIPPGQGIFTGSVKETNNAGQLLANIANATVTFVNLSTGDTVGEATSKIDGSFVSPALPGGNAYRLDIEAAAYKDITYQRPNLGAGASVSLGNLGMVQFSSEQGTAGMGFTVRLSDLPAEAVTVQVEIYAGYYVGDSDLDLTENTDEQTTDPATGEVGFGFDPLGDWGPLTVRVIAPGYVTQDRLVVLDDPTDFVEPDDFVLDPTQ